MEKRAREEAITDGIVENHDLFSSRCCDCDWDWDCDCDCDWDWDCEVETPSILLEHNNVIDSSSRDTIRSIDTEVLEEEEEDSFASDFYHCGTDWSSLLLPEKENDTKLKMKNNNNLHDPNAMQQRCLKQTNLFQMWGFPNRTNPNTPEMLQPCLKQTNLFQMWGFPNKTNPNTPDDKDHHHHHLQDHDINNASSSLPNHHHPNNKKIKSMFSAGSRPSSMKSNSNSNNNAFLLRRGMEGKSKTSSITNNSGVANKQRPRVCPFYKKIPGTSFTVDAFCYGRIEGCNAYILSHFHADHYGGLSKGWSHGPIYCTAITARLVKMCLSVNPLFIHPLELGTEYVIEGIKVTMLEANHCPGAALIYFCLPNGQCYLHTGDFRASKLMHAYPLLVNQRVNVLYLDTTYCNPKYRFPSKEDVMSFVVRVTQNCLRKQPKTLVIVGAYSIGKECVYLAISKALGVKIYANATRRRILQSFGWPELSGNLCSQGKETPLHVLPMSSLRFEVLERYLKTYMNQYTAVLAFRPTGWTYSETIGSYLDLIKPTSRGIVTIYGVPYSEHSSFTELQEFVQFLRPGKIIPTVNVGNAANRDKMQSYFQEWLKG